MKDKNVKPHQLKADGVFKMWEEVALILCFDGLHLGCHQAI